MGRSCLVDVRHRIILCLGTFAWTGQFLAHWRFSYGPGLGCLSYTFTGDTTATGRRRSSPICLCSTGTETCRQWRHQSLCERTSSVFQGAEATVVGMVAGASSCIDRCIRCVYCAVEELLQGAPEDLSLVQVLELYSKSPTFNHRCDTC